MDLAAPAPITTSSNNTKSPDADSDTPTKIPPSSSLKSLPFTNGVLKRHHHRQPSVIVSYKECLKNHAASLGAHALDGCGEFMPSPSATPTDPTSLKCAACGCHRNFHRRDPEDPISTLAINTAPTHVIEYQPHHRHHPHRRRFPGTEARIRHLLRRSRRRTTHLRRICYWRFQPGCRVVRRKISLRGIIRC